LHRDETSTFCFDLTCGMLLSAVSVSRFPRFPNRSTFSATALLASVSFAFVPFCAAYLVLALDSPIPNKQRILADHASVALLLLCLLLQPVAASIFRSRLLPNSTGWRKFIQFVGMTAVCAIGSIGFGLLVSGLAEERWRRAALSLLQIR
jgi:hypothetical protein